MMKITGIGHVAYNVKNLQKSLDYYCEALGFQAAFCLNDADGNPWLQYVQIAPGQFLELFPKSEDDTVTPPSPDNTYNHLCIIVESAKETADYLRSLGLLTSDAAKGKSGSVQCWSTDPDGNRIEFMEITPDCKQAEAEKHLGIHTVAHTEI